jgi:hypothetical protein
MSARVLRGIFMSWTLFLSQLPRETGVEEGRVGCRTHLCRVAHRQFVFTIPKRFRLYFRYDRKLLGNPCQAAWRSVRTVYQAVSGRPRKSWLGDEVRKEADSAHRHE